MGNLGESSVDFHQRFADAFSDLTGADLGQIKIEPCS